MRRAWAILTLWLMALGFAFNTGRPLAYTIFYLFTALIVLSYLWAWANIHWLRVNRISRARRSQVGRTTEERFEVENLSRLPKLWLEVRDFSDLPNHHASYGISNLKPREVRQWTVQTLCRFRGRYTLGPLMLTSGDPLGLFRLERHIMVTSPFLVYPATFDLPSFSPQEGQLSGGEATQRRTHHITTNVSGVRDYEPGDSFNRIHWRSTARTGRLVVKEFEQDPSSDLWLFIDMHADVQAGDGRDWLADEGADEGLTPAMLWQRRKRGQTVDILPFTEEYSVTVAASLARHYLQQSRAVGFVAYGREREMVQADRGDRQLNRILETLSVIQADGGIPLDQVLLAEGRYLGRHNTVVAITPSADTKWVRALRELRHRGLRSIAIIVAADSFEPAPPHDAALAELAVSGIPAYVVKKDDTIAAALSKPATAAGVIIPASKPAPNGDHPRARA